MVRRIFSLSLCFVLSSGAVIKQSVINNINTLALIDNISDFQDMQNQDKVWLDMPEENEFLQNGMNENNREVFRLRELRKERKKNQVNENAADLQIEEVVKKVRSKIPENKQTLQLHAQQGLGLSIRSKVKMGLDFVEVMSNNDENIAESGLLEDEIKVLEKKQNSTQNIEAHAALQAAISYLQKSNKTEANQIPNKGNWGIYTYMYNDGKCDYQKSLSLGEGQTMYRNRGVQDQATIFVANGELTRSKGDQVAIEVCQGKALVDGNLKMKTYNEDSIYVVNHEHNSIYNDVTKFGKEKMEDAKKEFNKYSQDDTTILVRGSDGGIIQKKGEANYVEQNLAYLYNDADSMGQPHNYALQQKPQD